MLPASFPDSLSSPLSLFMGAIFSPAADQWTTHTHSIILHTDAVSQKITEQQQQQRKLWRHSLYKYNSVFFSKSTEYYTVSSSSKNVDMGIAYRIQMR